MSPRSTSSRVLTAYLALRGRFDSLVELSNRIDVVEAELNEAKRVEVVLRDAIEKTQQEREYWYSLWFRMGTEFQGAQSALMDELDELRRKMGIKDASKLKELHELSAKQRESDFVRPEKHPSPAVKSELEHIACPPKKFDG